MRGRQRVFIRGEHFFVQLLAGTQPGVDDPDVVFVESGEADHVARQIGDFHRLAHVEHDDFAAVAGQPGLQHQLHRFRYGHEKARDFRVGHRHRAASRNLFAEFRNHAAG